GDGPGCPSKEGPAMAPKKTPVPPKIAGLLPKEEGPLFKLGDLVQIRYGPEMPGRIVELRGALGPNGAQIYRIRFRRKPKPFDIEVREDQIELIRSAEEEDRTHGPSASRGPATPSEE